MVVVGSCSGGVSVIVAGICCRRSVQLVPIVWATPKMPVSTEIANSCYCTCILFS